MRIRPERVAQIIHREVADILARKLRDPRLSQWVSVTSVEVNHDLTLARVFVSILPEGDERTKALDALGHAAGFVRHELAGRMDLREVPEVRFELDTSIEHGSRVEELLRRIKSGEPLEDTGESS